MSASVAIFMACARRSSARLRIALLLEDRGLRPQVCEGRLRLRSTGPPTSGACGRWTSFWSAHGRRLVPGLPAEARQAAQLLLEVRHDDGLRVDRDREGDLRASPTASRRRPSSRSDSRSGTRGAPRSRLRFRRDGEAHRVFLLVVAEAAPGGRGDGEHHRPFLLGRQHVEPVRAGRERLAADGRRACENSIVVFSFAPARQTGRTGPGRPRPSASRRPAGCSGSRCRSARPAG